jgi:hypothetical protein
MDLRREADALEARERDGAAPAAEEVEDEDEDEEDEDEEEGEEGEEGGDADADADASDDDDDEDAPKKKKKVKAKPKAKVAKAPAKKRTRAVKEVRMRATWVVFDNAGKRAGVFPYPQKKEAEELLAAKIEEKKTTFYLQLVKEEIKE